MLCIVCAVMCILLSAYKPEYAMAIVIVAGCIIFTSVIGRITPTLTKLQSILTAANIDSDWFKIAFKALGICYVTQFAADLCRDFGQSALASKAELAGKCAVFLLSVPLLEAIINIAVSFIGEA